MISDVVYLLRIFKMFHGLTNNPVSLCGKTFFTFRTSFVHKYFCLCSSICTIVFHSLVVAAFMSVSSSLLLYSVSLPLYLLIRFHIHRMARVCVRLGHQFKLKFVLEGRYARWFTANRKSQFRKRKCAQSLKIT